MLKKILSLLPIRLTYDKYVPMFYVNPYKFITGIKFIQKIRVKYWTNIAKQYGPFRPFYFREDPIIKDSNSKKKEIKNIYENGYAICENFFNEEDYQDLQIITFEDFARNSDDIKYSEVIIFDEKMIGTISKLL